MSDRNESHRDGAYDAGACGDPRGAESVGDDRGPTPPADFGSAGHPDEATGFFGHIGDLRDPAAGSVDFGDLDALDELDFDGVDDMVDFCRVHADDAFLDALGGALRDDRPYSGTVAESELAGLLTSWREDVDSEPIHELIDPRLAVATVAAARFRKRRTPRLLVPLAAAAAVLAIAFTGASLAAQDARPGDTLWGLTRVLYADHARSVEAAESVKQDLNVAQTALAQGNMIEARTKLEEASKGLPSVASEDGRDDLAAQHANLLSKLPDNPAVAVPPPPSGTPATAPATSSQPEPTTAPSSPVPTTTPSKQPTTPPTPPTTTTPQPSTSGSSPTSSSPTETARIDPGGSTGTPASAPGSGTSGSATQRQPLSETVADLGGPESGIAGTSTEP